MPGSVLKGPKREIFGLGIFAQIRPIWIGYLGTRPKNPKKLRLGHYIALYFPRFCVNAVGDSAKKKKFFELGRKKKLIYIASITTYLPLKGFFDFLIFTLF